MAFPEAIQLIKIVVLMPADKLTPYHVKILYPLKKSLFLTQWSLHFFESMWLLWSIRTFSDYPVMVVVLFYLLIKQVYNEKKLLGIQPPV